MAVGRSSPVHKAAIAISSLGCRSVIRRRAALSGKDTWLDSPPPFSWSWTGIQRRTAGPRDMPDAACTLGGRSRKLSRRPRGATASRSIRSLRRLGRWQLGRYAGRDDVVFGATTSGRSAEIPGIESIVGLFINTLPVRARIPSGEPLRSWLASLQKQQVELRQYEFVPLAQIEAWSELPAGQNLFESILVFENYPLESAAPGADSGFAVHRMDIVEQTNYTLTLSIQPAVDTLALEAAYDPGRFDAVTIDRLLSHFENLLAGIGAGLDQSPAELGQLERRGAPSADPRME